MGIIWRTFVLWLGCLLYGVPGTHHTVWQGATAGWSPKASVEAVQAYDAWDVQGWMDGAQADTHRRLDSVEWGMRNQLDLLLQHVYEWRDIEEAA